jgi:hypothetical protein
LDPTHACSLEALACVRPMAFLSGVFTFLTSSHCKLCPNTEGQTPPLLPLATHRLNRFCLAITSTNLSCFKNCRREPPLAHSLLRTDRSLMKVRPHPYSPSFCALCVLTLTGCHCKFRSPSPISNEGPNTLETGTMCHACDASCASCTGVTAQECTTCAGTDVLFNGECLAVCTSGFHPVSRGEDGFNACKPCLSNCEACAEQALFERYAYPKITQLKAESTDDWLTDANHASFYLPSIFALYDEVAVKVRRLRFSTEICTRGGHWIPRMFA